MVEYCVRKTPRDHPCLIRGEGESQTDRRGIGQEDEEVRSKGGGFRLTGPVDGSYLSKPEVPELKNGRRDFGVSVYS